MSLSKQLSVIYFSRNKLDCIFGPNLTVVSCLLPENTVKDLEIVNQEFLNQRIHSFFVSYKIAPCPLILILSQDIIFEKDFLSVGEDQLKVEIDKFLEMFPFEDIVKRVFIFDQKTKITAVNKTLISGIEEAFKKEGCTLLLVVPESILGYEISKLGLNSVFYQNIIHHFDTFKHFHLLEESYQTDRVEEIHQPFFKQMLKKKLFVFIAIFIFLIGILVVLILRR